MTDIPIGKHREFQRLTAPYARLLALPANGTVTNGHETGDEMVVN